MQVHYSLCERSFATKPSDTDTGFINNNLRTSIKLFKEFLNDVSQGKSFSGTIFTDDERENANFLTQQIFGVDFDKDVTVPDAVALLEEWGLTYTCGYYTFSHAEEKPRFRLLFVMDGLVECPKIATSILQSLFRFFGRKSDKNAKDISRIWHGTDKKYFMGSGGPINLIEFVEKLNIKVFSNDHLRERHCIRLEGIEQKTLSRNGEDYTIYYSNHHFSTHSTPHKSTESQEKQNVVKDWKIEELLRKLRVVREFISGTKLSHDVLMGLARNFLYLNGGQKLFKNVIEANSSYDPKKIDIMSWCRTKRPIPQWIRDFSPYEEDWLYQGSIIDQLNAKVQVDLIDAPALIEVEKASQQLTEELRKAINASGNDIYLIRSQAGLGKTNFMKNVEGIVMGFPTHKLKNEHFSTSPLQNKICTADLLEYFSPQLRRRFHALYGIDLGKNVQMEIKKLAIGELVIDASVEDIEGARRFLNDSDAIKSSGAGISVFTTHSKAISEQFPHSTIVLDESPLSVLLEQHFASKTEMETLCTALSRRGWDVNTLNQIISAEIGEVNDTPWVNIPDVEIRDIAVEKNFRTHIVRFFCSTTFIRTEAGFQYTINNVGKVSADKKYIILDATSSIGIYQHLFGERLKVVDISNVKYRGTLNQHVGLSYSKMGMRSYGDTLEIVPGVPVLTHKEYSTEDHYYFSLVGTNKYEGRDLVCVGTPHKPPVFYKLLMKNLGFENTDFTMQNRRIEYEGRGFKFYTFSDPALRQIHLETVEGELIQAINRARPIHHDVTVTLYSNFPLLQANYFF